MVLARTWVSANVDDGWVEAHLAALRAERAVLRRRLVEIRIEYEELVTLSAGMLCRQLSDNLLGDLSSACRQGKLLHGWRIA